MYFVVGLTCEGSPLLLLLLLFLFLLLLLLLHIITSHRDSHFSKRFFIWFCYWGGFTFIWLNLFKPVFQLFLSLLRSRFSAILDDIGVSQAPWRALSTIVCFLHESVCLLLLFGCLSIPFVCLPAFDCLFMSVFQSSSFVLSFAVCLSFFLSVFRSDCLSVSALCDCLFACLSFRRLSRLTNWPFIVSSQNEALDFATTVGYPCLLRPSYVLRSGSVHETFPKRTLQTKSQFNQNYNFELNET